MGATASRGRRSSPSLPGKYSLMEKRSTTRLFTVPDYSQCVLMPAGSVLLFRTFRLLGLDYSLEVYPAGLHKGGAEFLAVFVVPTEYRYKDDTRILIEILHGSREEHTVFDNSTAGSSQIMLASGGKGYVRFVKRKDLEASGCVRNDELTIRCTVSDGHEC